MNYVVYKNTNGMILRTGKCPDDLTILALQAGTGETAIEGVANDATQYVNTGTGLNVARPAITATWNKTTLIGNGSDTATLGSTLPNPTVVQVNVPAGVTPPDLETVTTGSFSFATPIAGLYTVTVTPPVPYQVYTQILTAT